MGNLTLPHSHLCLGSRHIFGCWSSVSTACHDFNHFPLFQVISLITGLHQSEWRHVWCLHSREIVSDAPQISVSTLSRLNHPLLRLKKNKIKKKLHDAITEVKKKKRNKKIPVSWAERWGLTPCANWKPGVVRDSLSGAVRSNNNGCDRKNIKKKNVIKEKPCASLASKHPAIHLEAIYRASCGFRHQLRLHNRCVPTLWKCLFLFAAEK